MAKEEIHIQRRSEAAEDLGKFALGATALWLGINMLPVNPIAGAVTSIWGVHEMFS